MAEDESPNVDESINAEDSEVEETEVDASDDPVNGDEEVIQARKSADLWRWAFRGVVTLGIVALVAFVTILFVLQQQRIDRADTRIEYLLETIEERNGEIDTLQEHNTELLDMLAQAQQLCEEADDCDAELLPDIQEVVEEQADEQEAAAVPVPQMVSDGSVAIAVSQYCSVDGRCSDEVTLEEMIQAVTIYCADGACQGEEGTEGPEGSEGAQGPGPTDEQVLNAVIAYCANGACQGPPGQNGTNGTNGQDGGTGPQGPEGPAGASIVGAECVDGALRFYLSTGTSIPSNVACTPTDPEPTEPEPTEDPTPTEEP